MIANCHKRKRVSSLKDDQDSSYKRVWIAQIEQINILSCEKLHNGSTQVFYVSKPNTINTHSMRERNCSISVL